MSASNSHHPSPISETRDPIMEDDHFSLRYGNPIKVIHDIKQHKVDNFEPTKDHVPSSLAEAIGAKEHPKRAPLVKSNSSFQRDSTICSEFFHSKNGSVTEVEHSE